MARQADQEVCAICGETLPEDPPDVTIPTGFGVKMTPLASPGVRRIEFCSERHRRDWLDAYRGTWPDDDDRGVGE